MAPRAPRPERHFDAGLQHERTAMAWERTAISMMVAGTLLARYSADDRHFVFALVGLGQAAFGAALLAWSGRHYDDLHGVLRANENPSHPLAARTVGLATVLSTGSALVVSILFVVA
jgi:uncharacterized membrane protein YidH (DUF202 family)